MVYIPLRYLEKREWIVDFIPEDSISKALRFYVYSLSIEGRAIDEDLKYQYVVSAGVDVNKSTAMLKAEMEFYERLLWMLYYKYMNKLYKKGKYFDKELKLDIYPNFSEEETYTVLNMYDLSDNREIDIPAELVLYVLPWSKQIYAPVSNGVAAHYNPVDAIYSSIMELIERDAVMRWWYLRLPVEIAYRIKLDKGTLYLLELPSEFAKVYLSVLDLKEYNGVIVGSGADVGRCSAMYKAIKELAHLYVSVDLVKQRIGKINSEKDIVMLEDLFAYWIARDPSPIYETVKQYKPLHIDTNLFTGKELNIDEKMKILNRFMKVYNLKFYYTNISLIDNIYVSIVYSPDLVPYQQIGNLLNKHPRLNEIKTTIPHPLA